MATTRRRGEELERAILESVLAELDEHGYQGLTYEGVAARAGTGKPVLYRRWPTKARMVLAAKAEQIVAPPSPDTGTLEQDLKQLLRSLRDVVETVGRESMLRLLADLDREGMEVLRGLVVTRGGEFIAPVLERARRRGEIPDVDLPPRMVALPMDLARHEFVMVGELPDHVIDGIVEEVVLPALGASPATLNV